MLKQGPLSGQTLGGKYLLGELLGKGGFGAVYKAENQMLRREQAVKVLLEEHFSDQKFRDRFIREARTLGALDHANIVHVDDIGLEGTLIYLVMPYISGGTLQDVLKNRSGPLALDEVTRYLEQICSALGYAHAQGVVHLDLKPLNLLVHRDGRLLLSDFGLAHLMEQGAIEGGTSLQFGSPLYMSPEHFDGNPSQRSDLYALGVILYQMLSGRHPFEASTPAAVMRKHLTEPPPSLHAAQPTLPVALDDVIRKALAKDPEQRYGRAGELLFDYRAALGGQALQFSSSAEQTRLSQVYLDPTQRAANPPAGPAGPTLYGAGPAAPAPGNPALVPPPPPLGYGPPPPPGFYAPGMPRPASVPLAAPIAPGKPKIWTPGFRWLFVLLAIGGAVVTIVTRFIIDGRNYIPADWLALLFLSVEVIVCLVGLGSIGSKLLRVGLLLQIGALVSNGVFFALLLHLDTTGYDPNFPYGWLNVGLPIILTAFNAASLVVVSYGMAHWQRRQGIGFLVFQVIASGIAAALLPISLGDAFSSLFSWAFLVLLGAFFAASIFLLRPACWKKYPGVTLLLGLGALLFVFQSPYGYNFFYQLAAHLNLDDYGTLYSASLLAWLLLLLGFLLIIQTERARLRAQQLVPVSAIVGQNPS